MPHNAKKKLNTAERREKVAELYRKGYSQQRIAASLGISQATVSRDINHMVDQLRNAQLEIVEDVRNVQVASLEAAKVEAWACYKQAVLGDSEGNSDLNAAARFLEVIIKIEKQIADLIGTPAPKRTEHTGNEGGPIAYKLIFPDD